MAFYVLCLRGWFIIYNSLIIVTSFTDVNSLKSLPAFCSCNLNFIVEDCRGGSLIKH